MLVTALCLLSGCVEPLKPGSFGTFRYYGIARGATPDLPLLPPYSDRDGNVYVFYGRTTVSGEDRVTVGQAAGGWSDSGHDCADITKGDNHGIYGWVGHSSDKAWYWSGQSLVSVTGTSGKCSAVLPNDPRSGTRLAFQAVFPWVQDTPSLKTIVALVKTDADPLPFQVLIDLGNEVFLSAEPFKPRDAAKGTISKLEILGVGADRETGEGFMVVRYEQVGATPADRSVFIEGRVVDDQGKNKAIVPLEGLDTLGLTDPLPAGAIDGFLHRSASGLIAGVDAATSTLVSFTASAPGTFRKIEGLSPVGVHPWKGSLYVVGTIVDPATGTGTLPAVAQIDDLGNVGVASPWQASLDTHNALKDPIIVENDRAVPRRREEWKSPRTAIGPYPFVHAHAPDRYAPDATGWLVAGPSFDFTGGEKMTSVAFAPVGISYP